MLLGVFYISLQAFPRKKTVRSRNFARHAGLLLHSTSFPASGIVQRTSATAFPGILAGWPDSRPVNNTHRHPLTRKGLPSKQSI